MSRTLNQLIAAAIDGGEEVEETSTPIVQPKVVETEKVASPHEFEDIEKLASALEFLGRRGVETFLVKEAASSCEPPAGTNMGQMHRPHTQSQIGPHAGAPPMKEPSYGKLPNNEKQRPGMPTQKDGVDTSATGKGTHHPALASNESAISYDKKEKAKKVAPALSAVLDTKAFADGKLKENLSNASGKGDKNIHKTAHELESVRAEIARRVAGGA